MNRYNILLSHKVAILLVYFSNSPRVFTMIALTAAGLETTDDANKVVRLDCIKFSSKSSPSTGFCSKD
jgi:hypothetical protein